MSDMRDELLQETRKHEANQQQNFLTFVVVVGGGVILGLLELRWPAILLWAYIASAVLNVYSICQICIINHRKDKILSSGILGGLFAGLYDAPKIFFLALLIRWAKAFF